MNSLKLSQYFELVKPTYKLLKIVADKSIKNSKTDNIAKAVAYMYKTINKRIHVEQRKLFFETSFKIAYIVDITKKNTNFYFMVPEVYTNILIEKIVEVWPKATVSIEDTLEEVSENSDVYQLSYKYNDALSLDVNRTSNEPLNSLLNVLEIMKDDDRVVIVYNFIPHKFYNWTTNYKNTIEDIKANRSIIRDKTSGEYIFKAGVSCLSNIVNSFIKVISEFLGHKEDYKSITFFDMLSATLEHHTELSNATKKKRDCVLLDTQIAVISDSKDVVRRYNNAVTVCQAYRALDENNELVYKKDKKINIEDTRFNYVDSNIFSSEECSNFIQIPGRQLLDKFGIEHIEVLESDIPQELQQGVMCIGQNTHRGVVNKVYLSNDVQYRNLTLCIIGPTRAGKTNLISHLSTDAVNNNETVIVFDFCGECDLSNEVSLHVDKNRILNIDCANYDHLEGLGYNEIIPKDDSTFELYRCAKTKTQQLVSLINSINSDNDLEPRMERYLEAAALITFISVGSIRDVFLVLQDHVIRQQYISKVPKNQLSNLEEYIHALKELDNWSKETKENSSEIVGTKISSIQGILNRSNKLKSNAYMELMLKKDCTNNIDLVNEMQKSQLICLRMPETMFSTEQEKDIYCTYWLTKIWGALQVRYYKLTAEKRIKVNIVFDELYQIPNCQSFLKTKINQIAKKNCKPIISCHSLEQIKYVAPELRSSNTSYILISGCTKDNYYELKEELAPYELEDLLNLKRYNALCLIKYNGGYSKFVSKLPGLLYKK